MLIAYRIIPIKSKTFSMTDSMNFGPDWIRNLSSEGTTGGSGGGAPRYQLADFRYGREEMLALFDKNVKSPPSLTHFKTLYHAETLEPLSLTPYSEEEERGWQSRPGGLSSGPRSRGGLIDRGTRPTGIRGRGGYQNYGTRQPYEGWGNGEQSNNDWSPRKDFGGRVSDNWRRNRSTEDEEGPQQTQTGGWRNSTQRVSVHDRWGRSTSWRGDGDAEERGGRWNDTRGAPPPSRRSWESGEDHLPEWATENPPVEGGGTFDSTGAFHGSDDEQTESKSSKRETTLHKSTSQQHITIKQNQSLPSSKSSLSLVKSDDNSINIEDVVKDRHEPGIKENTVPLEREKPDLHPIGNSVTLRDRDPPVETTKAPVIPEPPLPMTNGPLQDTSAINKTEEDLEDLVKLVVDEEPPSLAPPAAYEVQPPPNLPIGQDKWYYQDPQGQTQGPFSNIEMGEWYKAGYFSNQLLVRRLCDERFMMLGDLIPLCPTGTELFNARFPPFKGPAEDDRYQQFLSSFAVKRVMQSEPSAWVAALQQQQEMNAQRFQMQQMHQQQQQMAMQQQQQQQQQPHGNAPSEMPPFVGQMGQPNPLMMMINKMQQANKLPTHTLLDPKPPSLDPLLAAQLGNLHSLQSRMAPAGFPAAAALSSGPGLHLQQPPQDLPTANLQSLALGAGGGLGMGIAPQVPRPDQVDGVVENPIASFIKQLHQNKQLDSLWQPSPTVQPPVVPAAQWAEGWGTAERQAEPAVTSDQTVIKPPTPPNDREAEERKVKEAKKKREMEERQARKEAEEKKKLEQKRQQELEKKANEERKRKEEERMRKEAEKQKKEAEEKRLRELEEKRRMKELRKAEEEQRRKSEELKKQEADEKARKEREEAARRQEAATRAASAVRSAPWSPPNSSLGPSLTEIQRAEKERRAHEAALQLQRQAQNQERETLLNQEKAAATGWAKKSIEPTKVKSLAEIQAEEQDRLAKQQAEARLAALQKEKEAPPAVSSGFWNGQNLTWANASSTHPSGGFWDDLQPSKPKPSASKANAVKQAPAQQHPVQQPSNQQQSKQTKQASSVAGGKANKKEEKSGSANNEFNNWCYKTLGAIPNIPANVDIPTFVSFLRDIESALDVREYCAEYLGDSTQTQQFASAFLENRRFYLRPPKIHQDDLCCPAPAINPGSQEFQEVKGKNKKNKKGKMLKVDSRILGFNVTSAPDRINVGDRDYGDNS